MTRRRYTAQQARADAAWHAARMAEGPCGWLAAHGIKTWAQLRRVARTGTDRWEAMPMQARLAYAFPNPEDRG